MVDQTADVLPRTVVAVVHGVLFPALHLQSAVHRELADRATEDPQLVGGDVAGPVLVRVVDDLDDVRVPVDTEPTLGPDLRGRR